MNKAHYIYKTYHKALEIGILHPLNQTQSCVYYSFNRPFPFDGFILSINGLNKTNLFHLEDVWPEADTMLKQLRIYNFKGWQDTGLIRMAPITLFFGVNSSGKSSIGHFLMMLKQTVESPDRKAVLYPGGRNSAIQLGSYRDMVFKHDEEKKITFEYEWVLPKDLDFDDPLTKERYSGNSMSFEAQVGIDKKAGDKKDDEKKEEKPLVADYLKYQLHKDNDSTISFTMTRKNGGKTEFDVQADKYKLVRQLGRAWSIKAPYRFYGIPDEVVAYHQNAGFVQLLNLCQENLYRSVFYLGPLRTKPERLYAWSGNEPESVGFSGENAIAAILAARKRKINFGANRHTKPFEALLASELKEMELIEEFKVNPISIHRQEYEVKIRTIGSSEWVDLPDVGFGISQVLPVLVQCFYAPHNSIILMEQPEIHLHPKAQAALADVMIDVINSRENGKDRNIQLIIETHSEHFLRRLQRRIAENSDLYEKVSAYFANMTTPPPCLEPLQIDLYGNILNWPENFFGDEMGDITAQAKAALQKRKQLQKQQA